MTFLRHLHGYVFFMGIFLLCWVEEGWTEAFEAPGLGSRAYSLGGAFIGLADDWTAIFWNPSGLARQEGLNFGINLFSPRFNDYDGNSVHNFDPENFSLLQGDILPRVHPTEPVRFNEKWSKGNSAINPSLALVLGTDKGWAFAAGIYSPLGNLLSWDDLVTDPITQATIRVDYQTFMAIANMNLSLAKEVIKGLYLGLGTNLVYTKFKLRAKKYYTGSVDPLSPDYHYKFKSSSWDIQPEGIAGLLYQPQAKFSLGAVYRTGATMDLEGKARFGNTLLGLREKSRYAQEMNIPATYGIGLCYRITPRWLVAFDWQGTDWSPMRVKTNFERQGKGLVNQRKDLHWKRSSRLRFGTEYRLSERWRLLGGYFYAQPSLPKEAVSLTTIIDVPPSYRHLRGPI